jgi:formate dehydrogenase iron-sulfur subunit
MGSGILNDLTRCIGCGACALACKEANGLRHSEVDQLDAYTWCAIRKEKGVYVKRQCMHCFEPTCASVCPVGALHKTDVGAVVYEVDKCFGCRYCVMACPFKIPTYQWDTPLPRVGKCIMCYTTRLKEGRQPACTEVCPARATVFGDRDELLAAARERLRAAPTKYVPEVYGADIVGGTSLLYLSSVPFADLGFPQGLLKESYPALTWAVLSKIPQVVSIGGLSLLSVWWILGRRMRLAEERRVEAALPPGPGKGTSTGGKP